MWMDRLLGPEEAPGEGGDETDLDNETQRGLLATHALSAWLG
jgi:hypothetical protein